MHLIHQITFDDFEIFSNDSKKTVNDFIQNIPTNAIINFLSIVNSGIIYREDDQNAQEQLLLLWLDKVPNDVKQLIFLEINEINRKSKSPPVLFFSSISCTDLIQISIFNFCEGQSRDLTPVEALNLFRAYLKVASNENTDIIKCIDEANKTSINNHSKEEKWLRSTMPNIIAQVEFTAPKEFFSQAIKSYIFFQFIENNPEFSIYLKEFLDSNKVKSWKVYLKIIWNIYISLNQRIDRPLNPKNIVSAIKFSRNDKSEINFIESISVNPNRFLPVKKLFRKYEIQDFKFLRDYPSYNLGNNDYAFFNTNFLLDKVFQGILFSFLKIVEKKGLKAKVFKSKYSKYFTEERVFHQTMDYCIPNKFIKVNGEKYNNMEYSDYYARKEDRLILIEFKDRLMSSESKHSYDFQKIRGDLEDKFFKGQGIKQIINVLKTISEGGYEFDKISNSLLKKIKIYPIIVFTDMSYSADGINYIVNLEFKERLSKYNFPFKVKDLVMLELDYLIKYMEYFHDNDIELTTLVNNYVLFQKKSYFFNDIYSDPTSFLKKEIKRINNEKYKGKHPKTPKILKEIGQRIFNF